jgi:PKD repeat protein
VKGIEGAALASRFGYTADGTGLHVIDLGSCWVRGNEPVAAFNWSPSSPLVGEAVTFQDASTGSPTSWSWAFGNGARAGAPSPTVFYATAGTYTVSLDVANEDGSSRISREITIRPAGAPPAPAFEWSPSAPVAGQSAQFADRSTGGVTSWIWSFGDGDVATTASPAHTYRWPGSYTVALTVANQYGAASTSREVRVDHPADLVLAPKLVVPAQARAKGVGGSFFRTSFWVTASGDTATRVRLRYVPAVGYAMGGARPSSDLAIQPRQSLAFRDVLTELFGASSDTIGLIIVDVAQGDVTPLVTSRTYNDSTSGTYGQYIPAVSVEGSMPTEAWIYGLGGDAANRTNLGVVNLTTAPIRATISLSDAMSGTIGRAVERQIDANSSVQVNKINNVAGAGNPPLFSAKITASGRFFAYASKLDMVTSDPIYLPGDLTAGTAQWIDGVAQLPGVGGTFFKSNLLLANPETSSVTAEIGFTERRSTAPSVVTNVTLAAGESKYYAEAVKEICAVDLKSGMFRITSATPVVAWARTYNPVVVSGQPGAFGQFIPAFGAAQLIDGNGAIFQGLSQAADDTSGFRTNMGIINTGLSNASMAITVYRKEGSVAGRRSYSVSSGQPIFISKILSDVVGSSASLEDAYLKVVPTIPGAMYSWASMVDNRSTDPTFVRPLPIETTGTVETNPPTNPTVINGWSSPAKSTSMLSGQWYSYAAPYFEWTGASDADSGIAGYYVYFGDSATANPFLTGSFGRNPRFLVPSTMSSGTTYYLRVRAVDMAGNLGPSLATTFSYSFDTVVPVSRTAADFVGSGAATVWSRSTTLSLSASDDSGVVGYFVAETATPPLPSAAGWVGISSTKSYSAKVAFTLSSGDGAKTVYVWFKDRAGNVSAVTCDSVVLQTPTYELAGNWAGTYKTSVLPSGSTISFTLIQRGNSLSGTYSTGSGASGYFSGTLSGNQVAFTLAQTTPSCLGTFSGNGTVTSTHMTFTFSGSDCWGQHKNGQGQVTKQ